MKKLEKQLVSALAIGIGAGLMMCPVTAYADEGEPDDNKNDDPVTTDTGSEQQSEDNSGTQETSEAAQAVNNAATAVDTAQTAIENTVSGDYTNAGNALSVADLDISQAQVDLAKAEGADNTAAMDITDAAAKDSIGDQKAVSAGKSFDDSKKASSEAITTVDNIDVNTDTVVDAQKAATKAQESVTAAEEQLSAGDKTLKEAQNAYDAAFAKLTDLESKAETSKEELEQAQLCLEEAQTALLAAKEDVTTSESSASDAVSAFDDAVEKRIVDAKEELSKMTGEEDDYQEKIDALGQLIVNNYVLTTAEDKAAFANGEFSFTYSLGEDGEIVVTKVEEKEITTNVKHPGRAAGYYSADGEKFDNRNFTYVVVDTSGEKEVDYGYRHSELISEQDYGVNLDDPVVSPDGKEQTEYRQSNSIVYNDTEITTYTEDDVEKYAVKEKLFREYDVKTTREFVLASSGEASTDSSALGQVMAYYTEAQVKELVKNGQGSEWSVDNIEYKTREVVMPAGFSRYVCDVVVTMHKVEEKQKVYFAEKVYKATRFDYYDAIKEYTETITSNETVTTNVPTADTIAAAVQDYNDKFTAASAALEKAKAATTAYNNALDKVTAAREKVNALTDSFVSADEVKRAQDAHTAALANLESAQDKKIEAQNKLTEAKEALSKADIKIKIITERINAEQQASQNNEGNGQGGDNPTGDDVNPAGDGSNPTGDGENPTGVDEGSGVTPGGTNTDPISGNGGASGNDTVINDQPQIIPTISNATVTDNNTATTVTPLVAGVKTTVTRTAPTTRRAQMSQLAQSLSDEVARLNDAEMVEEKSEEPSKVLASTDAGSKAGKNVSKAFTSSVDGAVANIDDQEVALSATATNNSVKFPIIFALLGAIVAGVSVSEYLRMKKEDSEM